MPWIKATHDCRTPDANELKTRAVRNPSIWECPACGAQWELKSRNVGLNVFLAETVVETWARKSDGRDIADMLNNEDAALDH
jgi:hypothetical protein